MKKILAMVLSVLMVISACASAGAYIPGTYEASAQGFGGPVTVSITVSDDAITAVQMSAADETPTIGGAALETLTAQIMASGAEIDGVTGATLTSGAARTAAADALAQAAGIAKEEKALSMTPGTYQASTKGNNGDVTVSVSVDDAKILDITVVNHAETYGVGCGLTTSPIEVLPQQIVQTQSLAVDSVTSATVTSNAIKAAIADCIAQAGGDPETFRTEDAAARALEGISTEDETYDTDILVLGAGGAGLAAALTAKEAGARVLIMEKSGVTGGSTARSGGKVLAAGTKWQADQGFEDSADEMYDYLMSFDTDQLMNADLVKQFCDASLENITWLSDRDVPFINVEPIHSSITPWRVHNSLGGGGQTSGHGGQITVPLTKLYEALGGEIIYNCAATTLLTDESGAVVGAVGEKKHGGKVTVNAKNVVICTGGFAHSDEYMAPYAAFLPSNAYSGEPAVNVGDGLRMATAIGAKHVFNPGLQLVYVNYSCGLGINEESGLIVSAQGQRVVNEWTYQSHVASALARVGSPVGYYITATKAGMCAEPYPMVQYGVTLPTIPQAASIAELAAQIGMDGDALTATVARYNELCAKGQDEDFDKPAQYMIPVDGDVYYAFPMYPSSTVTFGGLQLDSKARVLDTNDTPIPGLYAGGEVAFGGLFGDEYPCCGMAIGSAVYFGRTAAQDILSK